MIKHGVEKLFTFLSCILIKSIEFQKSNLKSYTDMYRYHIYALLIFCGGFLILFQKLVWPLVFSDAGSDDKFDIIW